MWVRRSRWRGFGGIFEFEKGGPMSITYGIGTSLSKREREAGWRFNGRSPFSFNLSVDGGCHPVRRQRRVHTPIVVCLSTPSRWTSGFGFGYPSPITTNTKENATNHGQGRRRRRHIHTIAAAASIHLRIRYSNTLTECRSSSP